LGAWAGFMFLCWASPMPIIAPRLLLDRRFGIPIALNLVFRAGFAVTTYLVPQFLAVVQGYRPLDLARLMLWAAIPQVLALPLAWGLLHRLDSRAVMGLGLLACGLGTLLAMDGTSLVAADQFRLVLALFGLGQMLFLAPDLLIGASSLKLADLPTASLAFNMTTLGGTTLGVALVSNLATERQKFHSNIVTEGISLYSTFDTDRITALAGAFGNRVVDDAIATAQAAATIGVVARREAWVLAFDDTFLILGAVLVLSAVGVIAIGRCAALGSRPSSSPESRS
ncbi:MAG: EmrB/QacA subfamily drug resistance transporter, partial [Polaromonas sp.]|nr:EmrB/QacA subfamily drug resistance transporter [Polaromonas sp.]